MSLRFRIALISASAVAVAITIAAVVTFSAAKHELIAEVDASLYERADRIVEVENLVELASALSRFEDGLARGPFERGVRGFDAIFWQFIGVEGLSLFPGFPGGLPVGSEEQAVIDGDVASAIRTVNVGDDNLRMLTAALPVGAIQVARSLAEVDSSLEGLASVLRLAAVVGALLAGGVGYMVARGAARPIGELAEAAEHVAETQELAARIKVDRSDEVGRLAESFNAMLAALEGSREQQRRLVRDAGHELRTPLTALRTNVELLGRVKDIPDEDRDQMIADINSEIQELSLLVTELVDLAAEPRTAEIMSEELNLGELADRVADKYRRRSGRIINVTADDSMLEGGAAQIERAISNLIDNATKWSPDDSPIDVTVTAGRIEVSDHGPGIDEDDRPFVFDRFYRATKDRSSPGSGLGLSIVAKAAKDHGGTAFVADSTEGAVVGMALPISSPVPSVPHLGGKYRSGEAAGGGGSEQVSEPRSDS